MAPWPSPLICHAACLSSTLPPPRNISHVAENMHDHIRSGLPALSLLSFSSHLLLAGIYSRFLYQTIDGNAFASARTQASLGASALMLGFSAMSFLRIALAARARDQRMLRACHRTTPAARIFAVVTAVVALYTTVTAEVDCISFVDGGLGRDCRLLVDGAPPSVVVMVAGFLATVMAIQLYTMVLLEAVFAHNEQSKVLPPPYEYGLPQIISVPPDHTFSTTHYNKDGAVCPLETLMSKDYWCLTSRTASKGGPHPAFDLEDRTTGLQHEWLTRSVASVAVAGEGLL
ncbi:predicted protein [Postia placenta Mad-698-R]|nr:predicted protein [Postia placenta Mad-698-R]